MAEQLELLPYRPRRRPPKERARRRYVVSWRTLDGRQARSDALRWGSAKQLRDELRAAGMFPTVGLVFQNGRRAGR